MPTKAKETTLIIDHFAVVLKKGKSAENLVNKIEKLCQEYTEKPDDYYFNWSVEE